MTSYYFWFAASVVLVIAELATGTFYLLMVACGVTAGGIHNKAATYDEVRIRERARLIGYAIDARRQRFPDERPFAYQPHVREGLSYRWDDKARADIKDYNLLDLSI